MNVVLGTVVRQRVGSDFFPVIQDMVRNEAAIIKGASLGSTNSILSMSNSSPLAENAENQVQEMLDIPEIKEIWETIQQNKEAFRKQIEQMD